jgi:hypothetical protein
MRALTILIVLSIVFFTYKPILAQEDYVATNTTALEINEKQCSRFAKHSVKRIDKLTARIKKTNDAYLAKFKNAENALMQKLCFINELSAEAMMQDAWYSFNRFENMCARECNQSPKGYFAELDTLTQATEYLEEISNSKFQIPDSSAAQFEIWNLESENSTCVCSGLSEIKTANARLKKELKRSEMIGQYMRERQTFLNKALGKNPEGLAAMQGMRECTHYYSAQIKEYKNIFSDRTRLEKLLLSKLSKQPAFAEFIGTNGQLAIPAGRPSLSSGEGPRVRLEDLLAQAPDETKALMTALQTPAGAKAVELQQKFDEIKKMATDAKVEVENAKTTLQKATNMPGPERDIAADSLKQKDNKSTAHGQSKQESPDSLNQPTSKSINQQDKNWQPNPLKTKRFIDRLNYGGTFQADKRNNFFPTSGTLAGQSSYQLHKNSNIGIGASWIIGFDRNRGSGLSELPVIQSFNSNGFGMRSFIDFKLRSSIFIQGGYERNYRSLMRVNQLWKDKVGVSQSCLLGLKLKYRSSNKQSKPTLELLYDFMHNHTGQPAFVMRMGVEFNRKHGIK